jgi:hypothetical protein
MAMESASTKMLRLLLKPNNVFLALFEMQLQQLLLMNGTILETKTILFNPSDAAQNPK